LVAALTDERDDHEASESEEQIADADDEIIVAEVPTLDELRVPLDEAGIQPHTVAAETIAPTSDLDADPKVREAG